MKILLLSLAPLLCLAQVIPTPNPGDPIRITGPTGPAGPQGPAGGGVASVSGSGPSWLTWTITSPTTAPVISLAPTTAQTSHQFIGTCGAATIFAPCVMALSDLPGGVGLTASPLSQFASTTSAQLLGVISDETGTGALVFATSPTLVTPILGTPTSVTLTNATGLPVSTGVSGLAAGIATFLATPSSANLATAMTNETGTGLLVFNASPTFTGTITGAAQTLSGALTLSGLSTGTQVSCLGLNSSNAVVLLTGACGSGGGGSGTVTHTVGALASTAFMTGNAGADSQTPSSTSTLDTSGNAVFAGTVTAGGASSSHGIYFPQGSVVTPAANSVGFQSPTSVPTAFMYTLPTAPAVGLWHATNANPSVLSVSAVNLAGGSSEVTGLLPHANIAATAVTPGAYTNANITVAADGTVTAAANGTGSGGGYTTVDNNGSALTQRASLNFIPGTGGNVSCVDNAGATRTDCTISANFASALSIASDQAGKPIFCNSTNGTTAYTCTLAAAAALTTYTTGAAFVLNVDSTCTSSCTLAFDGLASKNVKQIDGSTDPGGALIAARPQWIYYNGTNFLLMGGGSGVGGTITLTGDTTGSGTSSIATATVAVNGTTVPTNSAADQVVVTTASATGAWKSVPSCLDSAGNHLNYNTSTHVFSCGTSSSGGGGGAFSSITGGTNTTAAMLVGSGASLAPTGTGTVTANLVADLVVSVNNAASPYTVAASVSYIVCDATAGAVTINLPAATATGREIAFKKTDSSVNACTITRAGSDTIDGVTSYAMGTQNGVTKIIDALSGTWQRQHTIALAGDVTGLSISNTVGKINGTALSGLATGLLKNTTTTGVPSIAVLADILALYTGTCDSSHFVLGDGSCLAASGTGNAARVNSPTFVTPALGTPASGNASNLTNLPITLTTTGTSGASTYTQSTNTLNIPQYTGGGGSGTVNSGTANQLAYYASTGTAVSGNANTSITSSLLGLNYNAAALPTALTGSVLQIANVDTTMTRLELDAFGATARFTVRAAAGTNASPTALTNGQQIGSFDAFGYNGSAYVGPQGAIRLFAAQNWVAGTAYGTFSDITTTPNGAVGALEVIRFENDGGITVPATVTGGDKGAATINAAGLFVNGTATVVASSPGAGIAHFAGSTQAVTSSSIVAADITNNTITGTQLASSLALVTPNIGVATGTSLALGGATIGSNGLAVTGTASVSGVFSSLDGITTVGTGVPIEGWQTVLTNSSATSLVTLATAPGAGDYIIEYGLDLHTACTTGSETMSLAFAWTGNSSRSATTGNWTIGTAQNTSEYFSGRQPIHVASGNVTFTPTASGCATGTATWDGLVYLTRVN